MLIFLSPIRSDAAFSASISGEVLTINGEALDLSGIEEGQSMAADEIGSAWITNYVTRTGGVLGVTLAFPVAANASEAARFPAPLDDPADGPLAIPE